MLTLRFWIMAGVLTLAVVGGLAWMTPVTHGQVAVVKQDEGPLVRRFEILGGRGSSIGVSVRDVAENEPASLKLPGGQGAVIDDVEADSPASTAGFKAGDVVLAFDGENVRSARQFARLVEETPAGRQVKATVMRQGARVDLDVTPGSGEGTAFSWHSPGREGTWVMPRGRVRVMPDLPAMPDVPELEKLPELRLELERSLAADRGVLGVGVQELTGDLAQYFGVEEGLLVNAVRADSPAARAGLKAGDVITQVDGAQVDDPAELRRRLRDTDSAEVTLGIVRDKKQMSVKATLEKPEKQVRKPRWSA
jgi:serine protease Do